VAEPPVNDASPLIILAEGGLLHLLKAQADEICLPRPAEAEVLRRGVIPAARIVVDHLLRTTDWYLSRELCERVLSQTGE
jgi:hypothetical protein